METIYIPHKMGMNLFILATFLLSILIGWMVIPQIVLISKKKRLFDALSDRKSHSGHIPRLGGVSFFPTFLLSLTFFLGLRCSFGYVFEPDVQIDSFTDLLFLISGIVLLFFIGLADDLSGMSYKIKFFAQIISACLIIFTGNYITNLGGLFGIYDINEYVGIVLTILFVVFITNAFNLIDGIDGLCSGLAMLSLIVFIWWFTWTEMYIYAMMAAAMLGVVVPFFYFNVGNKNLKIFMGDTGSLILGYIIAILGLKFYNMNVGSDIYGFESAPVILLGLLFIPAFDTIRVFFERISLKLSPFHSDRRHIHHKVLKLGFKHIHSTILILVLQIAFIALNLLLKDININILFCLNLILGVIMVKTIDYLGKKKDVKITAGKAVKVKE
ncbi:MAG: undecaprenyl/decaprenyl-phosphate alpha-N-acetylglucosaminyl 1-phosphate transferase [Rikenellaceae bacterium]|nr:undecaprenyl/decaprenyl-phosphate alpha-N-acetylglucosaminyl 1-phosphate transferase [Rikenellaceae bacterium]